ncbi:hypothetical protein D8770_26580 [Methylobacterium sp. DB1607]|nr:hypothetical protein [Methylobacterium sp. DB1607]
MSEAPKTVWVTKMLDSRGIVQCRVLGLFGGEAWVEWPGAIDGNAYFYGEDWHPTREAALARAEEMRAAKIASLHRQIERLESLEF